MQDNAAAFVIPLALGVAFIGVGLASGGALAIGWLILGILLLPVAYLRYKAARQPRD